MSNPILNQMNQTNTINKNPIQMITEFKKFANSMHGKNPEEMILNLLNNGKMSKNQFDNLLEQAKGLKDLLK